MGLVKDVQITLIDKTDSSKPTEREAYCIDRLKTKFPQGPNYQ